MTTEVLEQLDLTKGALRQDLLAEDICHLLDGDTLAGLDVGSRACFNGQHVSNEKLIPRAEYLPHDTIGSLTKLLGHIVLFVHDKVLVENLEDLAALQISHGGKAR